MKNISRLAINLLTCTGAGLSAWAIISASQGNIREAWILLGVTVLIDGIDGTLIRVLEIKDVLPQFDGDRLDEYADLLTFVVAPVLIGWLTNVIPLSVPGIITGILIIALSCLQFSHEHSKTERAFWGFPSYWNVVIFYGWGFGVTGCWMIGVCLVLCATLFAPIPFVYPSRFDVFRTLTIVLALIWTVMIFTYLVMSAPPTWLLPASFFYPVYYTVISFGLYPYMK
ncbi:MAG: phosphatidylcholine/phosphatidylserine synthase [bacterium]